MRYLLRVRPTPGAEPRPERSLHRSAVSSGALSGTACSTTPTSATAAAAAAVAPGMNPRMACSPMWHPNQRPDRPLSQYLSHATSTWLSSPAPPDHSGGSISEALNWQPRLPLTSTLLCLAVSAAATAAAAFLLPSPSRTASLRHTATLALIFIAALSYTRNFLLERLYLAHSRSETELGDPGSSFATFDGVTAHFKTSLYGHPLSDPNRRPAKDCLAPPPALPPAPSPGAETTAVHCYHGFGSNLYSYEPVHRRLSADLSALVTSHDMPGFGLTSRPPAGPNYYLAFNGRLGRQVQDHELSRLGLLKQLQQNSSSSSFTTERSPSSNSSSSMSSVSSTPGPLQDLDRDPSLPAPPAPQQQQGVTGPDSTDAAAAAAAAAAAGSGPQVSGGGGRVRRVLVGHSMGAICAALQAVEDPDVAALILVAPAILVMPGASKAQLQPLPPLPELTAPGSEVIQRFTPTTPSSSSSSSSAAPSRPRNALLQLAARVGSTLRVALLLGVLLLLRALRPLLFALLRAAVRSRKFWVQGLSQAFYDKKKLTDKAVDEYRLPQLVRGWEAGMCKFLEARLAPVQLADLWAPWRPAAREPGPEDAHLVERLAEAVRQRSAGAGGVPARPLRILLVHGRGDSLVPAANSERLARLLPGGGVELALLERCGHMPHEEWPELFSQLVTEFVSRG